VIKIKRHTKYRKEIIKNLVCDIDKIGVLLCILEKLDGIWTEQAHDHLKLQACV
jgi:hypothetical protein